ncbi:sulfatase family protein [Georgenia subflava]|uniref:Sulfatase-like hydrolase/transferase n=1 Tax=Georgenia subflava TaxID=1622177 RepID=A0A6N7EM55_9MICO|nr:sulfatase-like hydrolase/transferase [Georgenia subflava]MPV38153.1 sulfatase-like hydrolase/transferase [Georgenia subflava]
MRPNILLVTTDQHSGHMLSCAGATHVATPNLDRLAAEGARFDRAYVTFPLCVPSRISMATGMHPHELGVHSNSPAREPERVRGPQSLAHLLGAAGYRTGHAGKWHATRPDADTGDGFEWLREFGDAGLVEAAGEFLADQVGAERPFFLVVSFDDPHTICEVARNQPSYYGPVPSADLADAPNLPASFGRQPFEPEALRTEQAAAPFVYGTAAYTPEDWRRYRHHYARLVERADDRVGRLLAELDRTGLAESTVVVFTSDHGDGDAAHAWNQKTALYEEVVRVPLLVRWPGQVPAGTVAPTPVSVGLDLLPTLCDAAGVGPPSGLAGSSLLGTLADGARAGGDHVVVETTFVGSDRPSTHGRALVGSRYKYVVYGWGRYREQLFDLVEDPGEMVNLAVESRHAGLLEDCRRRLLDWCLATGDRLMLKRLVLPADVSPDVVEEIYAVPY